MNDFCYTTKQHTNKNIEYYINLHVTDKKKKEKTRSHSYKHSIT